jgi:methyl-accepting chemotaxis protein
MKLNTKITILITTALVLTSTLIGLISTQETYRTEWIAGITLAVLVAVLTVSIVFNRRNTTRPDYRIIESRNEGADQVASAAGQVSSSSQQMAAGASIEETLSSLEEMYSRTRTTRGKRTD